MMIKKIKNISLALIACIFLFPACNNSKPPANTIPVKSLDGRITLYFPYQWKQDIPAKYPDIVLGMSKSPLDLFWVFSYNKLNNDSFKGLKATAEEDLKGKQDQFKATVIKPVTEEKIAGEKAATYVYSIKNGPAELTHNVSTFESECCFIYIDAISKAENFKESEKEIKDIIKTIKIENPADIKDSGLLDANKNKNVYLTGTVEAFKPTAELNGSWGWQITLADGKAIPIGGFINSFEMNTLLGKKAVIFGNLFYGEIGTNKKDGYRMDIVSAKPVKQLGS